MGEMADDVLDYLFSDPWGETHWTTRGPRPVTCRYCGKRNLRWDQDEFDNNYLADSHGVPHVCADRVADASEFPCIS